MIMTIKKIIFFWQLFLPWVVAKGAVLSFTDSGVEKHWEVNTLSLKVHSNSSVSPISATSFISIANNAAYNWNNYNSRKIYLSDSNDTVKAGVNDLYFSANYPGLGSGTLGVTITTADEYSGKILEGDIVINSNYYFDENKLADVVEHEMGHFLGLGHSPVVGATMFYQWVSGQSSLAADDITGIAGKYPYQSALQGSISGRVIGGSELYPIFGAHVQAISQTSGVVIGATISGHNGEFVIKGLPIGDSYYLYISPLKLLEPLPKFYSSVKNNFCANGTSFVGGFFEGCNRRFEGHPQPIIVNSSVDVGEVSIHCGLNTPTDYYTAKDREGMLLINNQFFQYGEATVGYFTDQELETAYDANKAVDHYIIDLRERDDVLGKKLHINLATNLFLNNLSFLSYSVIIDKELFLDIVVKDYDDNELFTGSSKLVNSEQLSLSFDVPISTTNSHNLFFIDISVNAAKPEFYSEIGGLYNAYSSNQDSLDRRPFYFLNTYVADSVISSFGMPSNAFQGGDQRPQIESEALCSNVPNAYRLEPHLDLSALGTVNDRDQQAVLSCATIDFQDPPGGGGQALFTFAILLLLSFFPRYHLKR